MRAYWDSSALVEALSDVSLRKRLATDKGITRAHSLAEVFSTLTGSRLGVRVQTHSALAMIDDLAGDLRFVDLNSEEKLEAMDEAEAPGVRGGRVHDYLHAVAAVRGQCSVLLPTDRTAFAGLTGTVKVEQV